MNQTYLSVFDRLHVTNETQQTLTEIQNHGTDHPHPGLKDRENMDHIIILLFILTPVVTR